MIKKRLHVSLSSNSNTFTTRMILFMSKARLFSKKILRSWKRFTSLISRLDKLYKNLLTRSSVTMERRRRFAHCYFRHITMQSTTESRRHATSWCVANSLKWSTGSPKSTEFTTIELLSRSVYLSSDWVDSTSQIRFSWKFTRHQDSVRVWHKVPSN